MWLACCLLTLDVSWTALFLFSYSLVPQLGPAAQTTDSEELFMCEIYALVLLQTTHLEIFSFFKSDISNLAHRHLPKLAQIFCLIAIVLSGKFQKNRIVRSDSNSCPKNLISDSDKSRPILRSYEW